MTFPCSLLPLIRIVGRVARPRSLLPLADQCHERCHDEHQPQPVRSQSAKRQTHGSFKGYGDGPPPDAGKRIHGGKRVDGC